VGALNKLGRPFNQDYADMKVKTDQLKGLLTIDKLKQNFGGRITNKDIDLVATTVSGLSPDLSPEAFNTALTGIRQRLGLPSLGTTGSSKYAVTIEK
jgi:hypothetical protein